MTPIGTIVGTRGRPNTPSEFNFWIPVDEQSVSIGTIVKVSDDTSESFGIVEDMASYSEIDDVLMHQLSRGGDPRVTSPSKEQSTIVCRARILKQDMDRPLREGLVFYPSLEELSALFNLEDCHVPFGVFENTDGNRVPVLVNESYITGFEGAHVNISGMSGLGTKTSAFLFLLSSMFAHSRDSVACVLFNIKSDDLLYLDETSPSIDAADRSIYKTCGISPVGFKSRFFAPTDILERGNSLRDDIEVFRWGYAEIAGYIPSILKAGDPDQKEKLDTAFYDLARMTSERGLTSFFDILEFMREELLLDGKGWTDLVRGTYKATWGKLYNQMKGLDSKYLGLVTKYDDEVVELPYGELEDRSVWVVDIQKLGFYPRKLVFEKVISELVTRLEAKTLGVDKLIIFMDELNKYAPPSHSTEIASLKAKLIDISARGRSIGLSLFGAEQFKSRVDANIIGNISTDIYGKTKEAELMDPLYNKFSREVKEKMRRFKKWDKLLDHELFDAPVFVKMPRPPCMLGSDRIKIAKEVVA
jgi:DNA helicase HerA-like ATPase